MKQSYQVIIPFTQQQTVIVSGSIFGTIEAESEEEVIDKFTSLDHFKEDNIRAVLEDFVIRKRGEELENQSEFAIMFSDIQINQQQYPKFIKGQIIQ